MNLESLLNDIITSGIKSSDSETIRPDPNKIRSDSNKIRKIRILNTFQLVFVMLAPLVGLFYFYIGAIHLFYATIIAGLSMILALVLLRVVKNLVLVGTLAIFILWAILFIVAWNSGGLSCAGVTRPSWMLNAGLIMLAVFVNGYIAGILWTILIVLETGAFYYLLLAGYQFPNLIPNEISIAYSTGSYLICLLIMLSFTFLFENK